MIDFDTLRRPPTANTALYADPGDTASEADRPALRLDASPRDVIAAWDRIVREAPRTTVVRVDADRGVHYAIQRSRIFRFPDDVHAEARDAEGGGTRLLLYSAARFGRSDLGVNARRLADWTARLLTLLPSR